MRGGGVRGGGVRGGMTREQPTYLAIPSRAVRGGAKWCEVVRGGATLAREAGVQGGGGAGRRGCGLYCPLVRPHR